MINHVNIIILLTNKESHVRQIRPTCVLQFPKMPILIGKYIIILILIIRIIIIIITCGWLNVLFIARARHTSLVSQDFCVYGATFRTMLY